MPDQSTVELTLHQDDAALLDGGVSHVFQDVESVTLGEVCADHKSILFSERPWLVVVHHSLKSRADALVMHEQIFDALTIQGPNCIDDEKTYTIGVRWHDDGRLYRIPIASASSAYKGGGVLYLAPAHQPLGLGHRKADSEADIIDQIPALQRVGKIGEITRIPFDTTKTIIWRQAPTEAMADTGHAVYAEEGREGAISQRILS